MRWWGWVLIVLGINAVFVAGLARGAYIGRKSVEKKMRELAAFAEDQIREFETRWKNRQPPAE